MSNRLVLVSGDGHAGALADDYRPYMDRLALDHFDDYLEDVRTKLVEYERFTAPDGVYNPEWTEFVDVDHAVRSGGLDGAWSVERRLAEMDREGIAGEVLFLGPQTGMEPFFTPSNRPTPLDVRASGLRAFHRWMADHVAGAGGRLIPMADTTGVDIDAMVVELEWCAQHGFGGVQAPGLSADPALPPLYDNFYEPFWSACADLGFVVQFHAGWNLLAHGRQYAHADMMPSGAMMPDLKRVTDFRAEGLPRRALWQMMIGGVFDRHPALRVVLTEIRADWIPATLQAFDGRFERGGTPLTKRPSEYFAQHVYAAPSSPRDYEVAMRHEIGVDRFIFGRDFPHPEGTWPNTFEWIRAAFAGVSEDDARQMLGGNAIECFGFDRAAMHAVADRIGPEPALVLGEHSVDPKLVEHFDLRSGYSKPPVVVDCDQLIDSLDRELADAGIAGQ